MLKKSVVFLFAFLLIIGLAFSVYGQNFQRDFRDDDRRFGDSERCMVGCMVDKGLVPGRDCGPGAVGGEHPECFGCVEKCGFYGGPDDGPYDDRRDKKDDLLCLQCGDSCAPADFVAAALCLPPTKEFTCGVSNGECVVIETFVEFEGEVDLVDGGITPDSAFYFLDEFFDRFGDELEVREEKIDEIKLMIEAGNIEAAKVALKSYIDKAELLEKEVSPERKDEVLNSAAMIKKVIKDLEDKIPEEEEMNLLMIF
ncbi:hypothetical protein CL617_04735 [archaeon]|nr:hypothetical protein [archaeon]|tara:strand:+ start:4678 stop:5442 length:765 start_codon:yes stop_codon:yes gene_type:complete